MELLEAVRGGDTAAFGTLYRRHSAAARSLARQVVQGEDAVEDLLVEAFARVLEAVRRGGGPACAFRPYLLASVRRYAAAGVADLADGDSLYVDPELTGLERSPLARAYRSLPERWRALLWHVEIEGGRPADAGPLLGLSGRAAALLVRRARQGLREAYLRLHLENGPRAECRPILSMILRYVENGLPKQEAGEVDAHVAECIDCRSVFLQMIDLTQELRAVVGQLVAGPAVDGYLADLATATVTGARSYGGGMTGGTSGRGPNGRAGGRVGRRVGGRAVGRAVGGAVGSVGTRARARLEAVRQHIGALAGRADLRMRGAVRAAEDGTGTAGPTRGRADALRAACGRALAMIRRAWAKASAAPGAVWGTVWSTIWGTVWGRARAMTGRVYAKVGPEPGSRAGLTTGLIAGLKTGSKVGPAIGRALRMAFARVRAALVWLSELVRSVPRPHRAVLGGIAVAALATAAFLLVAQPTGVLFTGGTREQDGTRALDRPQPAAGPSRSQAATGDTSAAGVPSDPQTPSGEASHTAASGPAPEIVDDPAAESDADGPGAGIALGMPEITGEVTPGADQRSPRAEGRGSSGELPSATGHDDGRSAAPGVQGREGGQHADAGRESGRLTGRGQDGRGQGSRAQAGTEQTGTEQTGTGKGTEQTGTGQAGTGKGTEQTGTGQAGTGKGTEQAGTGQAGTGSTGQASRGQTGSERAGTGKSTGKSTGQAGRRPVSEPDTTVLADRERASRPADAAKASTPEREQVRRQLSRHPYQDHRAQAGAQGGAQGGQAGARGSVGSAQRSVQGSAQRSAQGSAESSAKAGARSSAQGGQPRSKADASGAEARAKGGARQTSEGARERREPQAGRPAADRAPKVRPGTAQGPRQAGERGREAREHAKSGGSHPGAQKAAGSGKKAKEALVAAVDPLGALLRGQTGLVAVRLRNAGDAATGEITATVTLPPGVRYLGQDGGRGRAAGGGKRQGHETKPGVSGQNGAAPEPGGGTGQGRAAGRTEGARSGNAASGSAGQGRAAGSTQGANAGSAVGDGWSCEASGRSVTGQVVRCVRGPLAAGEVTAIFLKVAVAADAPTGRAFTVRIRSGRLETTASSTVGVRASGAAARFAADGRLLARVVGNTLVGTAPAAPCGVATGGRGRASGVSVPVDLDKDPSTRTSSCADLDLPAGSRVLWAGLYWSGGGRGAAPAGDIKVRAPKAPGYATLHAAEVTRRDLPSGSGYQAFADVTSLVRTAGGGRWWVAGTPARTGSVRHAAWGLVVMAEDERQPYTRAVVLDAAAVIGSEEKALRLPLDGLAPGGAPARIDLMVWNGEGVKAGVVKMSDRASGGGADRSPEGVLGQGDAGGVAVDTLHALLGPRPALQLATRRDPVFFGVAVVSARTWS
ncbi:sigma factor [Microbispora hainanensis]|uniref:sigma factor n=1 Tax=Microbispora hainanensis TaxID=568844 RepID=UPI00324A767A